MRRGTFLTASLAGMAFILWLVDEANAWPSLPQEIGPIAARDAVGDPLPRHAVARLGTNRWRAPYGSVGLQFLPGGRELLWLGHDSVRVFDVASGKRIRTIFRDGTNDLIETIRLAASPAGAHVARISREATIDVVAVRDGRRVAQFSHGYAGPPAGLAFVGESRILVWGGHASQPMPDEVLIGNAALGGLGGGFGGGFGNLGGAPCIGGKRLFGPGKVGGALGGALGGGALGGIFGFAGRGAACGPVRGGGFVHDGPGNEPSAQNIKLFDLRSKRLARVLLDENDPIPTTGRGDAWINVIVPSPDAARLALVLYCANDNCVHLVMWDLRDDAPRHCILLPGNDRTATPAFSPDGGTLALPMSSGAVALYRSIDLTLIRTIDPIAKGSLSSLAFRPDGKLIAGVTPDDTIALFGPARRRILPQDSSEVSSYGSLAWSPDGTRLAQVWSPGRIRIWNADTGAEQTPPGDHGGPVTGLSISPCGRFVRSLHSDQTVRSWDVAAASLTKKTPFPKDASFAQFAAFDRLVLVKQDGALATWEIDRQQTIATLATKNATPLRSGNARVLPGGSYFDAHWGRIVDLDSGTVLEDHEKWTPECKHLKDIDPLEPPGMLAFIDWPKRRPLVAVGIARGWSGSNRPTGHHLLRGTRADGRVVWENGTLAETDCLVHLEISPDERAVLAHLVGEKYSIALLDLFTGRVRSRLEMEQFTGGVIANAMSPSGDVIAVGTERGEIQIFDIRRGVRVVSLASDQGMIHSLAFAPNGATLLSGGDDGTILVWDLAEPLRALRKDIRLSAGEQTALWHNLAGDEVQARGAIAALVDAPTCALALLTERLMFSPTLPVDVESLIAQLADGDFRRRDAAHARLATLGRDALPRLEAAARTTPGAEQRRRLSALLAAIEEHERFPSAAEHQALRALEVLETLGPAARPLLTRVAETSPSQRIRTDALAALERMPKHTLR